MAVLLLHAGVVEKGLKLTGVLLGCIGIGNAIGITIGLFEKKSLEEIEMWGFRGTAFGCLVGCFVMLCTWVVLGRA